MRSTTPARSARRRFRTRHRAAATTASWDAGAAGGGSGLELGGSLAWRHRPVGVELRVDGRYTVLHQEDRFEDRGVSVALSVDPGEPAQGLAFKLAPSWGSNPGAGASRWLAGDLSTGAPSLTPSPARIGIQPGQYEAALTYGWPSANRQRTLHATLTDGESANRMLRLGGTTTLYDPLGLTLSLELARVRDSRKQPGTAFMLKLRK